MDIYDIKLHKHTQTRLETHPLTQQQNTKVKKMYTLNAYKQMH